MSDFRKRPVRGYMSSPLLSVSADSTLDQVYKSLVARKVSCLAVVEGDRLVGAISRSDLLRVGRLADHGTASLGWDPRTPLLDFEDLPVGDFMTRELVTVEEDSPLDLACGLMVEHGLHRLFVGGESCVGVISTLDVMTAIRGAGCSEPIGSYMSSPVVAIDIKDTIDVATDKLRSCKISGLIAVEDDWPVGVFTQVEALAAKDLPENTPVEEAMDPALICMPVSTSLHRAARQAIRMRVRRIVASDKRHMCGLLSGLDFAAFGAMSA